MSFIDPKFSSSVDIRLIDGFSKADLKGSTFISGFHGLGESGYIAVNHLIEQLNAVKIGYILTDLLPPFITLKQGSLSLPFEIYYHENLVFVAPSFEPYRLEQRAFSKVLVDFCLECEMKAAYLIGGLDNRLMSIDEEADQLEDTSLETNPVTEDPSEDPSASEEMEDDELLSELFRVVKTAAFVSPDDPNFDLNDLDEGLFVTGPLALILMYFELNNFPALAILPYAERNRPDPSAASIALEVLNHLLEIDVDLAELEEEAFNIEADIQKMLDLSRSMQDERKFDQNFL
ncbi:MAG: proteasome assembly chaperone family protein [Candidatus Kariarchaeaceae archaeon]